MPSICSGVLMILWEGTMQPILRRLSSFSSNSMWHFLYLCPLPHQQGSFLPNNSMFVFLSSAGAGGTGFADSHSALLYHIFNKMGKRTGEDADFSFSKS